MLKLGLAVVAAFSLASCGTPPRYDWVKPNTTQTDKVSSLSECKYQIKLNKTNPVEQPELEKLCMQGKGFRLARVQ